jgi:hypothetical protein
VRDEQRLLDLVNYTGSKDGWDQRTRIFRAIDGCFVAGSAVGWEPNPPHSKPATKASERRRAPVTFAQNNFNFGMDQE